LHRHTNRGEGWGLQESGIAIFGQLLNFWQPAASAKKMKKMYLLNEKMAFIPSSEMNCSKLAFKTNYNICIPCTAENIFRDISCTTPVTVDMAHLLHRLEFVPYMYK